MKGLPSAAAELRRLFASQTDSDAKYFWKHIRYFNSHFSFTSFGVSIDHNLASARGTDVYCFKAHGQTIPNVGIYFPEPMFSHG